MPSGSPRSVGRLGGYAETRPSLSSTMRWTWRTGRRTYKERIYPYRTTSFLRTDGAARRSPPATVPGRGVRDTWPRTCGGCLYFSVTSIARSEEARPRCAVDAHGLVGGVQEPQGPRMAMGEPVRRVRRRSRFAALIRLGRYALDRATTPPTSPADPPFLPVASPAPAARPAHDSPYWTVWPGCLRRRDWLERPSAAPGRG